MAMFARLLASIGLILLTTSASAQELPHVPGELIAKMAEGADLAQLDAMLAQNGCVRNGAVEEMGLILVSFDPGIPVFDMAAQLEAQDDIEFADPNYLGEGGFVPNDSRFGSQWHHENRGGLLGTLGADIESVPAWDITRGDSSVVVAVLDTGIDSDHPEFAGRLLPGFDFVNNDSDPEDDHGHGSEVTGSPCGQRGQYFQCGRRRPLLQHPSGEGPEPSKSRVDLQFDPGSELRGRRGCHQYEPHRLSPHVRTCVSPSKRAKRWFDPHRVCWQWWFRGR